MKLEILKNDLLSLIGKTQNIAEKKPATTVLINILLIAEPNRLKVLATDLEVCLTDHVTAKVSSFGKVGVSAKNLFEIAKELSDGPIQLIKRENNWLEIRQGKFFSKIVGISDENYPIFPSIEAADSFKIKASLFQEMIDKTIFCVSNDVTRLHINGVYFEMSAKDGLKMVATDGHRLSLVKKQDVTKQISFNQSAIIPRKALNEIQKLIEGYTEEIEISLGGPVMILKCRSAVLLIRLIEARYPNYQQFIPQTLTENLIISKSEFLTSLKRVALLANQKSKAVLLTITKGKLEISSHNPDLGDAREELEINYQGKDMKIAYNAKYIQEVLSNISQEQIDLGISDISSPSLVRPHSDESYTCIVMPMRI